MVTYFIQDIVLRNAESWARLVRQSVTAAAVKSSKESFQLFRRAAIEKEREKALKQKRVEEDKEEAPKESRYAHRYSKCF